MLADNRQFECCVYNQEHRHRDLLVPLSELTKGPLVITAVLTDAQTKAGPQLLEPLNPTESYLVSPTLL
jgi:hypothetical protein